MPDDGDSGVFAGRRVQGLTCIEAFEGSRDRAEDFPLENLTFKDLGSSSPSCGGWELKYS